MVDKREFKLPETRHGEPGKVVDFDKAAEDLKCDKVMLTKSERPRFIDWARKQK